MQSLLKIIPEVSGKNGWPWNIETDIKIYNEEKKYPKISIVMPSYNQGCYIEEAIRSVVLQNYPNIEFIIIDGGSTDETVRIIKKYEPWIRYWVSEKDSGQSNAINKGICKCTGEIFNWLNSDDYYEPNALHEIASAFMNDKEALIVSGYENHFGENMETYVYKGTSLRHLLAETIELCEISQPSTFFKFSCIKDVNGVSEDLHYIMDGEMWVKILLLHGQKSFKKIHKTLVNFRFHVHSKTVNNYPDKGFLFERASIVTDLQRSIGIPEEIISHYIVKIYESPEVFRLNREWIINKKIINSRTLRIYFIKKYVTKQFIENNRRRIAYGIKQLVRNKSFDFFLLKSYVKFIAKLSLQK